MNGTTFICKAVLQLTFHLKTSFDFIMLYSTVALAFLLLATLSTANNNNANGGDQSVGGIHLFEFHGKHGGTGLGIKVIVVLILILIAVYIIIRYRTRKYVKKHIRPLTMRALEAAAPEALTCEH